MGEDSVTNRPTSVAKGVLGFFANSRRTAGLLCNHHVPQCGNFAVNESIGPLSWKRVILPNRFGQSEETLMSPELAEARAQFETWARDYDRVFWSSTFEEIEQNGVPENLIWTVLDDNDGSFIVTNGVLESGRMSAVGYHVTRRPWSEGETLVIVSDVNVPCDVCATAGEVNGETCEDCEGMGDIWIDLDDYAPTDSSVLGGLK